MSLNRARILSSENDSSCKQEQNTNVNIKITPRNTTQQPIQQPIHYPQVPTITPQITPQANFTTPQDSLGSPANSAFQYQPVINKNIQLDENNDLITQNKFLEILLSIYEQNPLRINNYLVCHSNSLMELIKILTNADKVELVIDEEQGCNGCISHSKYMTIQRILVTRDGKTNDLKYSYNDVHSILIKHNISLKICV